MVISSPIFSPTRSGREFGGIFDCVALDVAKAASANTVRKSVVAFDRSMGWIFFALGTFVSHSLHLYLHFPLLNPVWVFLFVCLNHLQRLPSFFSSE